MANQNIAAQLAKTLEHAGVKRIWGVTGDSLNGLSDALRKMETIQWMHVRHEEVAAFAAGAEAAATGELAVCAGSCGPGNLHLINGLFDAHRNHVPVLAIAAQIPSSEIGLSYFQETHPQELFKECSYYVELVTNPLQMPQALHRAMRTAILRRGVAVLVIPGDVALLEASVPADHWPALRQPRVVPQDADIALLASLLNNSSAITLLCGSGCAGAHDQVVALADKLAAPVVHALRGKEHVEWDNPFDVGMTGFIGLPKLQKKTDRKFLDAALKHYHEARKGLDDLATPAPANRPIHPQYLTRLVSELADDDAIFTADVGTPTVWSARYLQMNGRRRLIGSFNHGSMANAMPQALGAQAAFPKRQVISLSGDGGFTMLMGDFVSLVQLGLPVKVIVYDNAVLGFVAMEMKASGYLDTGTDLKNPDFAAMANAMGVLGLRVERSEDLKDALRQAFAHDGPALVDVVTATYELVTPPAIEMEQAKGFSLYMLKAILNGRGDEVVELAKTNLRL